MSAKDIEVAEAAFQLWNEGDRAGFLATFHPDAAFPPIPVGVNPLRN